MDLARNNLKWSYSIRMRRRYWPCLDHLPTCNKALSAESLSAVLTECDFRCYEKAENRSMTSNAYIDTACVANEHASDYPFRSRIVSIEFSVCSFARHYLSRQAHKKWKMKNWQVDVFVRHLGTHWRHICSFIRRYARSRGEYIALVPEAAFIGSDTRVTTAFRANDILHSLFATLWRTSAPRLFDILQCDKWERLLTRTICQWPDDNTAHYAISC